MPLLRPISYSQCILHTATLPRQLVRAVFLGESVDNDPYLSADKYCYTLYSLDFALHSFSINLSSVSSSSLFPDVAFTISFAVRIDRLILTECHLGPSLPKIPLDPRFSNRAVS